MSTITINGAKPVRASVQAIVTRANGTVEDLGMIAFYHRNPVINAVGNLYILVKRKIF